MATKVFILVGSGDKEVVKWPGLKYPWKATTEKWMEEVKVILFGPAEKLAAYDSEVQQKIRDLQEAGVEIMACKACSDEWNITGTLEEAGIEVIYVGPVISQLLKDGWASLSF